KTLPIFVLLLFCSCARNPTSSSASQSAGPFKPRVGEDVWAHWGTETYELATIKAIEGDRATVVFDGSSGDNFVKFPSEMMAIPTAPVKVMPGDYVLAQYPFQKQMWIGGRVNSVGGATVSVKHHRALCKIQCASPLRNLDRKSTRLNSSHQIISY